MKNLLIVFLICSILVSCKQSIEQSYYSNGQLKYSVPLINDLRNGELNKYYANGEIQYTSTWINGLKEGKATLYYQNGFVHVIENYKGGEPDGLISEYDSSGVLLKKINYDEGIKINETYFFENGSVEGEITMTSDTTYAVYYHRNGLVDEVSIRVGSELYFAKKFSDKGKLISSNLPVKSSGLENKYGIDITVNLLYSDCLKCSYLIILGLFDDNGNLVDEYYRNSFLKKEMSFAIRKNREIDFPIEGAIYELDSVGDVTGYTPFEILNGAPTGAHVPRVSG